MGAGNRDSRGLEDQSTISSGTLVDLKLLLVGETLVDTKQCHLNLTTNTSQCHR